MDLGPNLPLREPTLFILLSLAPRPQHGYAIMKEVELLSGGRIRLSTGTLYGAIKRLLEQGWIERLEDGAQEDGRQRKSYRLTDLGERILAAEAERLRSLLATAQNVLAREGA